MMRCTNRDNPSAKLEDGLKEDSSELSHWKYKTLEEIWNLVLTSPEGKKGGLYPFKNLKIEQLRGELWARDEDESGTKQQLQEKLIELLGGTTRVPALLYGEGLNQTQCEALVFEQLHCCLNHFSHVLQLPHHITDMDTLVTLKETLSIALKKGKFCCTDYFCALMQVTILLAGKADNSVMALLTTLVKWWEYFMPKKTPDVQSRSCSL